VSLTDPEAQSCCSGLRGGTIGARFENLETGTGGDVVLTSGACTVTTTTAQAAHPGFDAGQLSIGGDGLLKTVVPCTYEPTWGGYLCQSHYGESSSGQASVGANGIVTYSFGPETFNGDFVGSTLVVEGFGNTALNGVFSIVQHTQTTVSVANAAASGSSGETGVGISYAVFNAAGVGPGTADQDFLGTANQTITVDKITDTDGDVINFPLYVTHVRGSGFKLDIDSDKPDDFPSTAQTLTYSCGGSNGSCGDEVTPEQGAQNAMIVRGRATRAALNGQPPYVMVFDPNGTELELECVYPNSDVATIPSDVVQAILDFQPTRVQIGVSRVTRVTLPDPEHPDNTTQIVVGHSLTGHTDI
jgi:hypothetical protein